MFLYYVQFIIFSKIVCPIEDIAGNLKSTQNTYLFSFDYLLVILKVFTSFRDLHSFNLGLLFLLQKLFQDF